MDKFVVKRTNCKNQSQTGEERTNAIDVDAADGGSGNSLQVEAGGTEGQKRCRTFVEENREFHEEWQEKYCAVKVSSAVRCLVCDTEIGCPMALIKSPLRSRITDENLEHHLRCAASHLKVDIVKAVRAKQCNLSH